VKRHFPLLATLAVALAAPAIGSAQNPRLLATVGPGFTISLATADGQTVSQLAAGTYEVSVNDQSAIHNFHLIGPGVDQTTSVEFVGTTTWTVTLSGGSYVFVCDPHAAQMRGSFSVAAAQGPPVTTPTPTPAQAGGRLLATVGPGFTIGVRTTGGALVRAVGAGLWTIIVRDRSAIHNFHLTGPGVNRRTGVGFRGTATWRVRIAEGKTYRFVCDPHSRSMRGSFRGR